MDAMVYGETRSRGPNTGPLPLCKMPITVDDIMDGGTLVARDLFDLHDVLWTIERRESLRNALQKGKPRIPGLRGKPHRKP